MKWEGLMTARSYSIMRKSHVKRSNRAQRSLSLAVLQQAIERERRLLNLSVAQIEAKLASLEAKFGTRDRKSLFGKSTNIMSSNEPKDLLNYNSAEIAT